jgi:hypothetical protein
MMVDFSINKEFSLPLTVIVADACLPPTAPSSKNLKTNH